jgi:hypothetical protein
MAKRTAARDLAYSQIQSVPKAPARYAAFSDRLNKTVDMNPNVPPLGGGRLTYLREELARRGVEISLEAIRRWFSGLAVPRKEYVEILSEILRVDTSWLLEGENVSKRDALRQQNALADGAVNFVAGLIQLSGGAIAFPNDSDRFVDVHAIINGHHYPIRVIVAEQTDGGDMIFAVPAVHPQVVHVGVVPKARMRHDLYLITELAIDAATDGGAVARVSLGDEGVCQISSFERGFSK